MISRRSKLSLCQLLELLERSFLETLLEKHGLSLPVYIPDIELFFLNPRKPTFLDYIRRPVSSASEEQLQGLTAELVRTQRDLRNRVSPRYRWDERWLDLSRCLLLDGYRIDGACFAPIDPTVGGGETWEDDLTNEMRRSGLTGAEEVLRLMDSSATWFRAGPTGYNASLTDARTALQSLAREIALARTVRVPGNFDQRKWGEVLTYLRTSGLLTEQEEKAFAGVFTLISEGAHRPIGPDEQEMARLGRSLVATMSYFLVKLHNAQ